MKLENIGFYTLTDARASTASATSQLQRCELILTSRCNFKCAYCRSVGGKDISLLQARSIVNLWAKDGLKNIRFSGGEPTLYHGLHDLIVLSKSVGVERIAVSSNGSAPLALYLELYKAGVNDFSISLDADNAEESALMSGCKGAFTTIIENIKVLSALTYVTVGVVLTADNINKTEKIVYFADTLGVSDIRIMPAAQHGTKLPKLDLPLEILNKYPILRYRCNNLSRGHSVRGFDIADTSRCPLVLDDMAVMGDEHYPCIKYMREHGKPIGKVGPCMRAEREKWSLSHNCHQDLICAGNCLDVCRDYNNTWMRLNNKERAV